MWGMGIQRYRKLNLKSHIEFEHSILTSIILLIIKTWPQWPDFYQRRRISKIFSISSILAMFSVVLLFYRLVRYVFWPKIKIKWPLLDIWVTKIFSKLDWENKIFINSSEMSPLVLLSKISNFSNDFMKMFLWR